MTDLPAAIREAYAYATADAEVATIGLRPPSIVDETGHAGCIRLTAIEAPPSEPEAEPYFRARLEATAPLNPGEVVEFVRGGFRVERPERSTSGAAQFALSVDNVDARIGQALTLVSKTDVPVALTVRVFTMGSRPSGEPEVPDGFEITEPEITPVTVTVRGQGPDVIKMKFARQRHDGRFPLLGL